MNHIRKDGAIFVGYEYMELPAKGERAAFYLDCYRNFGWVQAEPPLKTPPRGASTLVLKRDRKIRNKTELTRLQQHFEACLKQLEALERSRTARASLWAILVGLLGTVFLAGATFAITGSTSHILLCVGLAVPGFAGWIAPWVLYPALVRRRRKTVDALQEETYHELYAICQKGHELLL